jgi:hypothetical protein
MLHHWAGERAISHKRNETFQKKSRKKQDRNLGNKKLNV